MFCERKENSINAINYTNNGMLSPIQSKSLQIHNSISHQQRLQQHQHLRNILHKSTIDWQHMKFNQFNNQVQLFNNPYSIALTMFEMAESLNWRAITAQIQILIKKFHNLCYEDNTCVRHLCNIQHFQERLTNMLSLGDHHILSHLKLLISILLLLNKRYGFLNQKEMSQSILNIYQYDVDVLWMLAQSQCSSKAISKILKKQLIQTNLLPIITIIANWVVDAQHHQISQLLNTPQIQKVLQAGLNNNIYQIQRESILLLNNIISKNANCFIIIYSWKDLIEKVKTIQNEQKVIFDQIIELRLRSLQNGQIID